MDTVIFNIKAFTKAFSHGLKHPQDKIYGFFTGLILPGKSARAIDYYNSHIKGESLKLSVPNADESQLVVCLDAIPIAHTHCLPHVNRLATVMAEQFCKENNMRIVGYYQAESRLYINNCTITQENIEHPESLSKYFKSRSIDVFMCSIQYTYIDEEPLKCLQIINNANVKTVFITPSTRKVLEDIMDNSHYLSLMDIDDHLDMVENDFTNKEFLSNYSKEAETDPSEIVAYMRRRLT